MIFAPFREERGTSTHAGRGSFSDSETCLLLLFRISEKLLVADKPFTTTFESLVINLGSASVAVRWHLKRSTTIDLLVCHGCFSLQIVRSSLQIAIIRNFAGEFLYCNSIAGELLLQSEARACLVVSISL